MQLTKTNWSTIRISRPLKTTAQDLNQREQVAETEALAAF